MSDLTDIQAAGTTKIVGSDLSGIETAPISSSPNGEMDVSDICDNSGVNGNIVVGLTSIEAKVGVSTLSNRKVLTVFHNGAKNLYWGLSSGVTIANGTQIFKNQLVTFDVGPNTHIWLIADTAGQDVRLTEMA